MIPNNTHLKVLDSAARTATNNSGDLKNMFARGVLVTLDVTAATGLPSIVLVIEAKDPVSEKYEVLLSATAVTAVGIHSYLVYPGAGAAAGDVTQVAGFPLSRTWRVRVTHANADSITYSVGANLLI